MKPIVRKSLAEQTAAHIRDGLKAGLWTSKLPGVLSLSRHFKVSGHTIRGALKLLEREGLLADGGTCRARSLSGQHAPSLGRQLRIGILPCIPVHQDNAFSQQLLHTIREDLTASGHVCFLTNTTLNHLKNDPKRVLRFLSKESADGWIVYTATRDVLETLATQQRPIYSLGGSYADLPIAGSGAVLLPALEQTVDRLVALGHRRIVAICPTFWRHPKRGRTANAFLELLRSKGLPVGDYNLPEWDESKEGLESILVSLFKVTPPTALLVVEPSHTVAVLSFLARNRLMVPEDVSLMTMMSDPILEWQTPTLTTMEWPMEQHVRHIHRWAKKVAMEGTCHDKAEYMADPREGQTISHAPPRSVNTLSS